ncbi:unnamed protein product [Phaedon cochleariae]|uniref:C2H2-type domain-containing protein n=1 Tax=Phaedon cochleariae TaxID=80249 RepID=A0A9N9X352_PHACE|nr:unnamed protein product [Phaedon cochleariae]
MGFPKNCLVCSAESYKFFSIQEDGANMLEALTSIKTEDNTRPTEACIKCWLNLKYANRIQKRFLRDRRPQNFTDFTGFDHIEVDEVHLQDDDRKSELELDFQSTNPPEVVVEKNPNIENDEKICNENIVHKSENKITSCKICGDPIFEDEMLEHTRSHFFSRIKCDQCNMYCNNIESYRNHVGQAHSDSLSRILTCKICKTTFSYKPLYLIHLNKAHRRRQGLSLKLKKNRDDNKLHDCPYCNKRFKSEENCLKHMKGHNKKKCNLCGLLVTPSNFTAHVKTHKEKPVACHICGMFYKNSVCLRSHIHYTHSTTTYLCEFCDKVYKKSYALSMHIKKEHTGEKSHTCDVCGKRFFTFFNLNTHKKMTHLKLRPHACQYCNKKFSSKFARVTHERQHTNVKPYKCEICGQGYRQNVSLKSHKKSAHDIVEELTCKCEVCGKKFASNFAVLSHMRLH